MEGQWQRLFLKNLKSCSATHRKYRHSSSLRPLFINCYSSHKRRNGVHYHIFICSSLFVQISPLPFLAFHSSPYPSEPPSEINQWLVSPRAQEITTWPWQLGRKGHNSEPSPGAPCAWHSGMGSRTPLGSIWRHHCYWRAVLEART